MIFVQIAQEYNVLGYRFRTLSIDPKRFLNNQDRIKRRRAFVLCSFNQKVCLVLSRKSGEKTCLFKNMAIGNQNGLESSKVLPKK